MDRKKGSGSGRKKSSSHRKSSGAKLPLLIIERILSFLPLPVLCRFRSVCKRWKELLSKPSFHATWELNGRTKPYLFAVRSVVNLATEYEYLDPAFLHPICFFDVHERRWYSIKASHPRSEIALSTYFAEDFDLPSELAPKPHFGALVGMDDGLLCEGMRSRDKTQILSIVLTDPVAETKKEILVPPMPCRRGGSDSGHPDYFPMVVTAWRRVGGALEIFLLNNGRDADPTQMLVQEPSAGGWQEVKIPLTEFELRKALSAVIFRGILYITFYSRTLCPESRSKLCILMSYDLEKGTWKEVPLRLPTRVGRSVRSYFPRDFVVSGGRLFLMMWGLGHSGPMNFEASFAVVEILNTSSTKVVVRIPTSCTRYRNPDNLSQYLLALFTYGYGVPCVDSGGICRSVLWVTVESGEVAVCDMASGAMTNLTPHPLRDVEGREMTEDDHPLGRYLRTKYRWRYMNLNWTKLLSGGVVTNA